MAGPSVTYTFSNSTTADATQVNQNFTDLINGLTDGTKDLSISALTAAGTATLNGNINLGNATGDDLTITASLASSISIKTTFSYDVGSATIGIKSIYFGSNDSAAKSVRLISGAVGTSYTLTLPTGVPSTDGSALISTTAGVTSWRAFTAPKATYYSSGSGTHTFTGSPIAVRIRMAGGGGGGGGSSTSAAVNGGAGGAGAASKIDTTALVANGGSAGGGSSTNGPGGAGGSASKTIGVGIASTGQAGTGSGIGGTGTYFPGGMGGSSLHPGGGKGGEAATAGSSGATNSGGGGGGGGSPSAGTGGGGGGGGGYVDVLIYGTDLSGLSGDVTYEVGTGGSAGGAGTSGTGGGTGAAGFIEITEFYQ